MFHHSSRTQHILPLAVPPSKDQVFKHVSLRRASHIQTTEGALTGQSSIPQIWLWLHRFVCSYASTVKPSYSAGHPNNLCSIMAGGHASPRRHCFTTPVPPPFPPALTRFPMSSSQCPLKGVLCTQLFSEHWVTVIQHRQPMFRCLPGSEFLVRPHLDFSHLKTRACAAFSNSNGPPSSGS